MEEHTQIGYLRLDCSRSKALINWFIYRQHSFSNHEPAVIFKSSGFAHAFPCSYLPLPAGHHRHRLYKDNAPPVSSDRVHTLVTGCVHVQKLAAAIVLVLNPLPVPPDAGKHRAVMGHGVHNGGRFSAFYYSPLSVDYVLDAGDFVFLHTKSNGEEGIKQKRLAHYRRYAPYRYTTGDVSNELLASLYRLICTTVTAYPFSGRGNRHNADACGAFICKADEIGKKGEHHLHHDNLRNNSQLDRRLWIRTCF